MLTGTDTDSQLGFGLLFIYYSLYLLLCASVNVKSFAVQKIKKVTLCELLRVCVCASVQTLSVWRWKVACNPFVSSLILLSRL